MRKTARILLFLLLPVAAQAQTITIGPITKLSYCVGDTLQVPYTATGNFAADNHFFVELSDADGSFVSFTPSEKKSVDTISIIPIPLSTLGSNFHVRVTSTDPLINSQDNGSDISTVSYPVVQVKAIRNGVDYDIIFDSAWDSYSKSFIPFHQLGLIDESIVFHNKYPNSNLTFQWQFDQSASIRASTDSTPIISFSTDGYKQATLTVTNAVGCASSQSFGFSIGSCNPVIPAGTRIVTGDTSHIEAPYILVRAGGSYGVDTFQVVFVEAGGDVRIGSGIIYLMQGASIHFVGDASRATIFLPSGIPTLADDIYDTLRCNSISFDYSKLNAGIEVEKTSNITISENATHLLAHCEGAQLTIGLLNILGTTVLTRSSQGDLDVDLSALPAGVYFAEVRAGASREVRRIIR
jgi:hypothetical protein